MAEPLNVFANITIFGLSVKFGLEYFRIYDQFLLVDLQLVGRLDGPRRLLRLFPMNRPHAFLYRYFFFQAVAGLAPGNVRLRRTPPLRFACGPPS